MSSEPNAIYFARRAAEERAIMLRSTDATAREAHRQLTELYNAAANLNDNAAIGSDTIEAIMPVRRGMQHLP